MNISETWRKRVRTPKDLTIHTEVEMTSAIQKNIKSCSQLLTTMCVVMPKCTIIWSSHRLHYGCVVSLCVHGLFKGKNKAIDLDSEVLDLDLDEQSSAVSLLHTIFDTIKQLMEAQRNKKAIHCKCIFTNAYFTYF